MKGLYPKAVAGILTVAVLGTVLTGDVGLLVPALLAVTVVYGLSRSCR